MRIDIILTHAHTCNNFATLGQSCNSDRSATVWQFCNTSVLHICNTVADQTQWHLCNSVAILQHRCCKWEPFATLANIGMQLIIIRNLVCKWEPFAKWQTPPRCCVLCMFSAFIFGDNSEITKKTLDTPLIK